MNGGTLVQLAVYDLSRGMATQLSKSILGIDIEAIYHTGVRLFGYEYFFSSGLQKLRPESVANEFGIKPMEILDMGETDLPEAVVDCFIDECRPRFTSDTYDILKHNCNNFSDELVFFLTNLHIPSKILDLPNQLLSTPIGQRITPFLESMGATRAIPLSGSQSMPLMESTTEYTQLLPSISLSEEMSEMNMSCLQIWNKQRIEFALSDLRQRCYNSDAYCCNICKTMLGMDKMTSHGNVCFTGIKDVIAFISEKACDISYESMLFDVLIVLSRHIEIAGKLIHSHGSYSEAVINSITSELIRLVKNESQSDRVRIVSMICLSAIVSSEISSVYMLKNDEISDLIKGCDLENETNEMKRMVKASFVANFTYGIDVSREEHDASDMCFIIINLLCGGLLKEKSKVILEIRLTGLYILAKRGGITEKLCMLSNGIGSEQKLSIDECNAQWNALTKLIEKTNLLLYVCFAKRLFHSFRKWFIS